ncbi:MAG: helix-turn-helix transcriptional regulator [Proteobacteria bacterium]|nr:helix-turn-helix transcriptional regulator [Pseudomonadota bacterium]MCH8082341.1 helix-turn-helix transcriptional regulator [Pseudomonadota bacterium]MCH8323305.1 helix-turn-helix transcriptional regulator [Pseudomonadota bacterium]
MQKSIHTKRYQKLCKLLREGRKKAGLTQTEVAKRLGRPQSFVAKYELGERRLDVIEFMDIAGAIGMNPAKIIKKI